MALGRSSFKARARKWALPAAHNTIFTMAEPQPAQIHEGATEENPVEDKAGREAKKEAAALNNLEDRSEDAEEKKDVDTDALGKAMKGLDEKKVAADKEKAAQAKKIKIDAADVALLVDQLDLTKNKATEFLRSYNGDAVKAMTAFVTGSG